MSDMEIILDVLLEMLARSGLVDNTALTALRCEFKGNSASEFASHLVSKSAITKWQAEQLLKCRYKGFFVDGRYKLVDHVGDTNLRIRYLAEDLQTKKTVVLAMMPYTHQYLVEEQ